jgi:hypothetical protein
MFSIGVAAWRCCRATGYAVLRSDLGLRIDRGQCGRAGMPSSLWPFWKGENLWHGEGAWVAGLANKGGVTLLISESQVVDLLHVDLLDLDLVGFWSTYRRFPMIGAWHHRISRAVIRSCAPLSSSSEVSWGHGRMARRLLMGIWLEALLSCRYDGTCLNKYSFPWN